MDILPEAIDGFALYPLDEKSTLPALMNNRVKDGFPGSAVLAFKCFHVKDKQKRAARQLAAVIPQQPSPFRHNNEEDNKQPTAMWGVIHVTGNGNIKKACESLAWDLVDTGLQIRWEDHQSADLSAQVLLMNVMPVLDRARVEGEIIWHLTSIKRHQIGKGTLTSEYLVFLLQEIRVAWCQNKQGAGERGK
jgi:hypothetical protein